MTLNTAGNLASPHPVERGLAAATLTVAVPSALLVRTPVRPAESARVDA